MPALTVKLPAQLPPSCRQLPWLSHITDTELLALGSSSSSQSPVSIKILFYSGAARQAGTAPPPTLNIYLLMSREKQSGKMETRSSCQLILLIAKFPDLRTTNTEQVESAKSTKMLAYRVPGELRILEFEFSQFMRLFLISNM